MDTSVHNVHSTKQFLDFLTLQSKIRFLCLYLRNSFPSLLLNFRNITCRLCSLGLCHPVAFGTGTCYSSKKCMRPSSAFLRKPVNHPIKIKIYKVTAYSRVLPENLIVAQLPADFMKPEVSLHVHYRPSAVSIRGLISSAQNLPSNFPNIHLILHPIYA
jgi:hypothetical protein